MNRIPATGTDMQRGSLAIHTEKGTEARGDIGAPDSVLLASEHVVASDSGAHPRIQSSMRLHAHTTLLCCLYRWFSSVRDSRSASRSSRPLVTPGLAAIATTPSRRQLSRREGRAALV